MEKQSQFRNSNLLYRLSLSIWTARKKDEQESSKVTHDAGAADGVANVHKVLLPNCPELVAIRKWADALRTVVYSRTSLWGDDGWRIGQVSKHMELVSDVGDRITQGEQLAEEFYAAYRKAIAEAKHTLGGMFNLSDYPSEIELRGKFSFKLDVMPLPNASDFRIVEGVPADEVDKLIDIAKHSTEARINEAMNEAYQRLYDVVTKMSSTLTAFGNEDIKKFNDSLLGNIGDLVNLMPGLNIIGDPKLEALATQAKELTQYALVDLRQNPKVRKAAIKEAKLLALAVKGEVVAPPKAPAKKAVKKVAVKKVAVPAKKATAPKHRPTPVASRPALEIVPASKPDARSLFGDMLNTDDA